MQMHCTVVSCFCIETLLDLPLCNDKSVLIGVPLLPLPFVAASTSVDILRDEKYSLHICQHVVLMTNLLHYMYHAFK